jgi:WD40 repeat protein
MTLRNNGDATQVYTGSRDHVVRGYEMKTPFPEFATPSIEFSPPHYDGVTALTIHNNSLISCSRDKNIMRFSLVDGKRDHVEAKAHDKWINDMCLLQPPVNGADRTLLATACKEGTLKLWDVSQSRKLPLVETIKQAHKGSINALSANSQFLFTGSSDDDHAVGMWQITA